MTTPMQNQDLVSSGNENVGMAKGVTQRALCHNSLQSMLSQVLDSDMSPAHKKFPLSISPNLAIMPPLEQLFSTSTAMPGECEQEFDLLISLAGFLDGILKE